MADDVGAPESSAAAAVLLEGWSAAGRATILQAADGRWEAARNLAVPAHADRARALVRDAGPAGADVAVEFEWLGHPFVFVGARRGDGDAAASEAAVAALATQEPAGPAEALASKCGSRPLLHAGCRAAWHAASVCGSGRRRP